MEEKKRFLELIEKISAIEESSCNEQSISELELLKQRISTALNTRFNIRFNKLSFYDKFDEDDIPFEEIS